MLTRRDLITAASALGLMGRDARAQPAVPANEDEMVRGFAPVGQVTLLHVTDLHAQLMPLYFREPSWNLGVGDARGQVPHLTGDALLRHYAMRERSLGAYLYAPGNFEALAAEFGRIGGIDRLATLVRAIRAERAGRVLFLDGGDTWQGSYTALQSRGEDMVQVMNLLRPDAMTAHWEFTYGAERVLQLKDQLRFPFLCGNVRETSFEDEVFDGDAAFERGGLKIAVIGQAFPYTPIANPRWMIPEWSFGIREEALAERVQRVREGGADLVVLLSHNGFDVDRKLAGRVRGIDVILTGHTHDALPDVVRVGQTLLVASGSHGKFLARLDLEVRDRRVVAHRFALLPILADRIRPDPEMAALVAQIRAPHKATLERVLGRAETTLYRRGNFAGTFDDLICQALLAERDAEIALSPGFRWGGTLPAGAPITVEDVYNQTAITYPKVYRTEFTGAFLKEVLEDVADNLFNPDPYLQQGGDMVRVGGVSFTIDVAARIGARISDLRLMRTGETIAADKRYVVAGWASVNEATEGPPVWDLVMQHIGRHGAVRIEENRSVRVQNA